MPDTAGIPDDSARLSNVCEKFPATPIRLRSPLTRLSSKRAVADGSNSLATRMDPSGDSHYAESVVLGQCRENASTDVPNVGRALAQVRVGHLLDRADQLLDACRRAAANRRRGVRHHAHEVFGLGQSGLEIGDRFSREHGNDERFRAGDCRKPRGRAVQRLGLYGENKRLRRGDRFGVQCEPVTLCEAKSLATAKARERSRRRPASPRRASL